mmetsp:Transcript_16082/g.31501  ORF Transcript_16082/g.31501 Transcript_16082/m.31501 type:complete len:431 (-) Transcript_16082:431-1723(-)|eukprot:CAMPEP_0175140970 /NCGR_PEP_ID=MMETSP0087-20121206/11819_1 /TAXON_ID=136419 /ORGANISM="Unknown Unknown, Strain D1" /LENGTH=430 /DNA_ID=CAMNT_0016424281 /DNA_START=183 /DNA_END=1475 /DNA_ORIENTATION=-
MTENVNPNNPSSGLRRSKRLSIDYDNDGQPNSSRGNGRAVLADITSVHNTQRSDKKNCLKSLSAKKLRKTSDPTEDGVLTRSRSKAPFKPGASRRQSDVAMAEPNGELGISELSLAMEVESDEEAETSSSSQDVSKQPNSMQASPFVSHSQSSEEARQSLDLWVRESDPCYEYADEIYHNLKENELKFRPAENYMTTMQNDINHTMRSILVDWLVEVGQEYQLSSQTFFLTINYIDRLLSNVAVNRSKLQLLGITCMLIAAKYEEIYPPSIDEFVYISDNTYTREQVLRMESVLLTSLKFHLSAATPWEFCRRFCQASRVDDRTKMLADFLCETFLLEPTSLKYNPSNIASAAIFLALYTLNCEPWPATLRIASGYGVRDLMPCVKELLLAHQKMCSGDTSTLKAVREKYKDEKFHHVATIEPKQQISIS